LQMRQVTPGITQYVSERAATPAPAPAPHGGEGAR
jgi:cell division protein FtsL